MDPISDMLSRIRNAARVGHREVLIPFSNFKKEIAEILKENKFIEDVSRESEGKKDFLKIALKYFRDEKGNRLSCIQGIRRVSRQGQRIYVGKDRLPVVKKGYGLAIISTSQGLMTDSQARKAGLGGEIICEIW